MPAIDRSEPYADLMRLAVALLEAVRRGERAAS